MPNWKDIFGHGSVAEQFLIWNVVAQLVGPLMNPAMQAIANEIWSLDPNVPLSPEAVASLVARHKLTLEQGSGIAEKSGTGRDNFEHMVAGAKHGPPLEALIEGVRRKLVSRLGEGTGPGSFAAGLAELGVDEKWWDLLGELVVNKPSGEAALNALLQGQIDHDLAFRLWVEAGEDPEWFQHAFDSQGTAPTPDMLGTMANRKIIKWDGQGPGVVSFRQGFLEGPWRDKWLDPMRKLMEYLPPPRTVTAMVRDGSVSDELALRLWEAEGLTPELAQAYLRSAHHAKVETEKELTKAEVARLFREGKLTEAKALELIEALGYSKANAQLILSMAQVQKADTHLTAAMNKVHSLYVAHKIKRQAAVDSLKDLKVADDQAKELLALWDLEVEINVRQLTPAQIIAAWESKILTEQEAMVELQHLGYTAFDAWVLLSTKNGKALPNKPAQGASAGVNP